MYKAPSEQINNVVRKYMLMMFRGKTNLHENELQFRGVVARAAPINVLVKTHFIVHSKLCHLTTLAVHHIFTLTTASEGMDMHDLGKNKERGL